MNYLLKFIRELRWVVGALLKVSRGVCFFDHNPKNFSVKVVGSFVFVHQLADLNV